MLTITPLYAGLLAIFYLALSYRVVQQRGHGVSLGDGGDQELLRRIRGHGNFAEYVPLMLLLLAMVEFGGGYPPLLLHVLGASLVAARVLHGISLSYTSGWKFGRFYGTLLSFILLLALGVLNLWRGIAAMSI